MEKISTEVQVSVTIKELESCYKVLQFLEECTFKEVEGRSVIKKAAFHMVQFENLVERIKTNFEPSPLEGAEKVELEEPKEGEEEEKDEL